MMAGIVHAQPLERPRTRYKCPICGNDDGAAGIRKRAPHQRGDWGNRWWVECRKCQGSQRDGDYLKLLSTHLGTNPVTLLKDARKLLRQAGLLLDSTTGGGGSTAETNGAVADLKTDKWPAWHADLMARPELHALVGGTRLVRRYELMFVPADAWRNNRAALAWPILDYGQPVNLVRRFFNGEPPYANAQHGKIGLWPDVMEMPDDKTIVLVAGMRDASFARAARVYAYTTTAGVSSWSRLNEWAPGRDFVLAFDEGESHMATNVRRRLLDNNAKSARILTMPPGIKDLAKLGERQGLPAIKRLVTRAK